MDRTHAEFSGQRQALKDALRDGTKRKALLTAFGAVGDLALWVVDKRVLRETAQRYLWKPDAARPPIVGAAVTDAELVKLEGEIAAGARPAPDPLYNIEPAIVMGWHFEPAELVAWGPNTVHEIHARLIRLEPLWRLLARA